MVDVLASAAVPFECGGEAWYFDESVRVDRQYLYGKLRERIRPANPS